MKRSNKIIGKRRFCTFPTMFGTVLRTFKRFHGTIRVRPVDRSIKLLFEVQNIVLNKSLVLTLEISTKAFTKSFEFIKIPFFIHLFSLLRL